MRKTKPKENPATQRGRVRLSFDLTKKSHELLRRASFEQHIAQVSLLELMIRKYCSKPEERNPNELF